ncbi:MAG: phosphatidylglycerophosphatase A [Nitrospinae bacterium]|nr:phosphatidylglycerophosphatase A [Nitrospinota bacterium]
MFIATGAYSGYSPIAPGTAGSIVGLLLCFVLDYLPVYAYLSAALAVIAAGVLVSGMAETIFKRKDPKEVVIDEIAGMLITLFLVPPGLVSALCGFTLFRLFDIAKPGLRWAEKIPGGWGIMLDDILAGAMANILLRVIMALFHQPL